MLSLLRDLGIVSLGVAAAAYALNEGTELRNALAVAAVGIAFNLLVWVILLCRKRRAGGKEPARQAAAPRPEANGGGKPSAASASASATASATSSASVARSPSSPLGLRERLRRLYLVKNPRKLGEIEKLVARYGHREDALLAKLQKKYGGEPSDAEVAAAIAAGGNSVPAVASAAPIAAGGGAGGGGGSESVLAEPIGDLRALVEMMGGSPPDQVENMLTIRRMDKICEGFARVMDSMGSSMALARKDFRSNMKKLTTMPSAVSLDDRTTLSEALEAEIAAGIHKPGPRPKVKDPSVAVGALWLMRTLAFNTAIFDHLAGTGDAQMATSDAGKLAYAEALLPYHGFMLRQIFKVAIKGMPRRDDFFNQFASPAAAAEGRAETVVLADIRAFVPLAKRLIEAVMAVIRKYEVEHIEKV